MQITVRDACELLHISESTIYRLIRKKEIPAYQINKSYVFNRIELLEWAITNNVSVSPKAINSLAQPILSLPTIVSSIKAGGIHYNVPGSKKQEVLRELVNRLPTGSIKNLDFESIYSALVARETLGSTGIGNGIAIPHVRNPILLDVEKPLIVLCFLEKPIDFGAIDNKPVNIFFNLISTTVRVHLHMLARLSYLLQSQTVRTHLEKRSKSEAILDAMNQVEQQIPEQG